MICEWTNIDDHKHFSVGSHVLLEQICQLGVSEWDMLLALEHSTDHVL